MATIIKRAKTFRITVSLGYDGNGKQIRKTTTFKPPEGVTEKKAEKLAQQFAFEFEQKCHGMTSLNENMRFSDLCTWYFETYAPNTLKGVTVYTYQKQVEKHLQPVFGNMKLKDFTPAKITAFFQSIDLSPSTCKKLYTIMQSIFARSTEQGFLKETPCRNVILPKNNSERKPFLDDSQAKELLKIVSDYSQLNTIVKVLLYTGMRSSECLGLQWRDIDFENHVIRIEHSLADVGGNHYLQKPKTKCSKRWLAMSTVLEDILKEHKVEQKKKIEYVGEGYAHPEMVFTSELGNFLDRSSLNHQFKKIIKNTSFSFASLHSLRHCNATLLINSGVDLKIVSEHLGHSGVGITADTYADVIAATKAKVADLIAFDLQENNK